MPFNIFLVSLLPQHDPITNFGNTVVNKAKMTKAMWFTTVVMTLIYFFILSYSKIPFFNEAVYLTKNDIRVAFWINTILGIILILAFSGPELIRSYKQSIKD